MYLKKLILILLIEFFCLDSSMAEPVWLCSKDKTMAETEAVETSMNENEFTIADLGNSNGVISISIRDLIDVYSGRLVKVGGRALSACYLTGNNRISDEALDSLGLNINVIKSLAKSSAIVRSQLFGVTNQEEMLSCIDEHFPAVGYLSQAKSTPNVDSCF